jgi:D-alanyl-lipoteichoic acid acyltransferase DltB (MBOAT superfamily)
MLWGLFKKVMIADRLALTVNKVYGDIPGHSGGDFILATVFFAFQIYCDFSGYSDMARGAARVMGFDLMKNFDRPYSSRSIAEFWTRWHISLSTWFKDYVYIPLGGNRRGIPVLYRNLMITFVISGLWHGANWTFLIWGGLNGAYLVAENFLKRSVRLGVKTTNPFWSPLKIVATFSLISLSWVFFRATSISDANAILVSALTEVSLSHFTVIPLKDVLVGFALIAFLEAGQFLFRTEAQQVRWDNAPRRIRWAAYYSGILLIALAGEFGSSSFIYFQF